MSNANRVRITARIVAVRMICAVLPVAAAHANGRVTVNPQACGSPTEPVEVLLPYEMQGSFFQSLPIAGLPETPDALAQRMITTPRVPATTARPLSGKSGPAYPISRSRNVGRRADQIL